MPMNCNLIWEAGWRLKLCTGTRPTPRPVPPPSNVYGTEEPCRANYRMIERFLECWTAVSFVFALRCPTNEMSLECGNRGTRQASKSKLRPKRGDVRGDTGLRDDGQPTCEQNETSTVGARPSNSMIGRAACPYFPVRGTKKA